MKGWTQDRRQAQSEMMKGNQYRRGKQHTEETKKKISKGNKGKKRTEEQKQRYRESMARRLADPKYREKLRRVAKASHNSPEYREKMSAILMGRKVPWLKGKTYEEIFGSSERAEERARITSGWMKERNIIHAPGAREKMGASKKRFYQLHPDKHPNIIMARTKKDSFGYPSKPQRELFEKIKQQYPNQQVVLEHPVRHKTGTFFLDVAIPNLKLDYEYDEPYWHNKTNDDRRDKILSQLGWTIIRTSGRDEIFE